MRKFLIVLLILSFFSMAAFAENEVLSNVIEGTSIEVVEPVPKVVTIYWDAQPTMKVGDTVTIYSVLEGFEECEEILYQWMYDKGEGNGYEPIPNATEATYRFDVSKELMSYSYKLVVYFK